MLQNDNFSAAWRVSHRVHIAYRPCTPIALFEPTVEEFA